MEKIIYNDYELLYLIKRGSDVAYEMLHRKYELCIYDLVKVIPYTYQDKDDIVQDCLMGITKAIESFDANYNVLFYTYVSLIFKRIISKFWRQYYRDGETLEYMIYRGNKVLMESKVSYDKELIKIKTKNQYEDLINRLSTFEKLVFNEILVNNMSKDKFVKKYDTNIKRIYNCVHVIKTKFSIILSEDN